MTRDQFIHALELGLGRAILYARDHDVSEFKDVILDACLHCWSYDPQVEGTREAYMADLLNVVPDRDSYYDDVLKSLARCNDDYDAAQRFHFARRLALSGRRQAKRAMYESYDPGSQMGEDIGVDFLRTDGISGLLFAAEKIGAWMLAHPGETGDKGWLVHESLEILGGNETWNALRDAAARNPRIEAYLATVEDNRSLWDRSKRTKEILLGSYDELLSRRREGSFGALVVWGEQASDADFERAARGLAEAKGFQEQFFHLRIFSRRAFPLDVEALLPFVDAEERQLAIVALKALSRITHAKVRALAFRLVDECAEWRGYAIELLVRNYQPGDHDTVLDWFEAEEDAGELHQFGFGLRDFWQQHPSAESEPEMLRALYEKGPCSVCRKRAVQRLIELNALTDEIRAECAHDANYELRELVKG